MIYLVLFLLGMIGCYGLFRWEWQSSPVSLPAVSLSKVKKARLSQLTSRAEKEELEYQLALLLKRGWSAQSLASIYLAEADLAHAFKELNLVASPLFIRMWQAETSLLSPLLARKALKIVLATLKFPNELTGHREQVERLLTRFADVAPEASFWQTMSRVVEVAFADQDLAQNSDNLARQIHQLRYVISRQQLSWVRSHYGGESVSDRSALLIYLKTLDKNQVQLRESARLHNKGEVRRLPNVKILVNFHSEFILDGEGNFLDVLAGEREGQINGASFNYAGRHGLRHMQLDIKPVRVHDPLFRLKLLKELPPSPNRQSKDFYGLANPIGHYAVEGQSLAYRIHNQIKDFEKELKIV